jgi:phosphomannomutase
MFKRRQYSIPLQKDLPERRFGDIIIKYSIIFKFNMMKINPNIFRAYDIRGVYPDEINKKVIYKIGQTFVNYTRAKKILVARDIRLSSKRLRDSLVNGICSQGVRVLDIGLCSTPCFYFTVAVSEIDAGIMVTASHSGRDFNGLKMVLAKNVPLARNKIEELRDIVLGKSHNVISSAVKIERLLLIQVMGWPGSM